MPAYNPKALVALKNAPGCQPTQWPQFVNRLNEVYGQYTIDINNGVTAVDGRVLLPGDYGEFLRSDDVAEPPKVIALAPAEEKAPPKVVLPPKEPEVNVKPEYDYEEVGKGKKRTFKCMHCEKTLRTEKGMLNHVDKKHR